MTTSALDIQNSETPSDEPLSSEIQAGASQPPFNISALNLRVSLLLQLSTQTGRASIQRANEFQYALYSELLKLVKSNKSLFRFLT